MPSKPAKSNKKEQSARTDNPELASNNLSMEGIAGLLEDHRRALSADFKSAISTLEAKLDRIQATVSDHGQTIASLESNANLQDERMLALEATCATLTDSNVKLLAKVTDLESRSRRNNIRIVGLPESIEGPHPWRSLQKEKIIREARARRGKLQYQGTPIAIYEDYTPEVMEQSYKYREVMAELYNLGLKPALLFPARLSIVSKEGTNAWRSLDAKKQLDPNIVAAIAKYVQEKHSDFTFKDVTNVMRTKLNNESKNR
ncbi:hypothetical protein KUCAC02_007095 [Chaenocephalus aceratus]|nr:hypothetical protein KUCAC02_007095 [Chaenocephalus aceratus]